jgi:hypothetical protein
MNKKNDFAVFYNLKVHEHLEIDSAEIFLTRDLDEIEAMKSRIPSKPFSKGSDLDHLVETLEYYTLSFNVENKKPHLRRRGFPLRGNCFI